MIDDTTQVEQHALPTMRERVFALVGCWVQFQFFTKFGLEKVGHHRLLAIFPDHMEFETPNAEHWFATLKIDDIFMCGVDPDSAALESKWVTATRAKNGNLVLAGSGH